MNAFDDIASFHFESQGKSEFQISQATTYKFILTEKLENNFT